MMMKKESFGNSHLIKNECEEIPAINIKKECSVSCDEHEHDPSEPDPAAGGCDEIMSQDWSVKDEMFRDILIKEEIKVEDLEDELHLPDHVEERLNSQKENSANGTSEPVLQNCLQEKRWKTEKEKICTLTRNERILTGEKPCSYLAGNKGHLQPHGRIHTLLGTLDKHVRTHRGGRPFKCSSCPFQAARKGMLKAHERTHTGEKPFKCSFCSFQATRLGNLKNHERTHTGERPFKCSSCSYQAITLGTLKNHERTHTGERPFKCSYCPYRATLLATLKDHERTHTGERPFKCSSCPYQAARIEPLKRHAKIHTGERPFKCSSCPYQAALKGALKTHVRMHTGERPFKCSSCSYQVMTLGSLKKHERTHTT